jgi:C4-type Zn-finger protein
MRDASLPSDPEGFTCPVCGRFIVTAIDGLWRTPRAGSVRRFCDPACRQAAYRRRRAGVAETTPRQPTGGRNRHLTTNDKEAPPTATTHD